MDIKREKKKRLTVDDLLKRFGKASGEVFANDRTLLSGIILFRISGLPSTSLMINIEI